MENINEWIPKILSCWFLFTPGIVILLIGYLGFREMAVKWFSKTETYDGR